MNKRKLIYGSIFMVLGTVLNIYVSTVLHCLLSKSPVIFDFKGCITSLFANPQQMKIAACFELMLILLVVLSGIGKFKEFRTDVIKITDSISTPAPAGHFEHGSSRWMTEEEKEKYFASVTVKK